MSACDYTLEREHHIQTAAGEVGRYVILTGDPGRCEYFASYFENAHLVARSREYTTWTGTLKGEGISVCSTGIGGSSASIAMEELIHCGARVFIRVGTAGGMQEDVMGGHLVIATGAVRNEGTSREYAPIELPAVADYSIVEALKHSAEEQGFPYHLGVVHCKDSFYGQHSPENMPVSEELLAKWNAYRRCGVLASEMESAALFTVAQARGVRMGTVLMVAGNQIRRQRGLSDPQQFDTENALLTAVGAMKKLISANLADRSIPDPL